MEPVKATRNCSQTLGCGNKLVGVNGSSLNIQESANVTITLMNRTLVCTMVIVDDITVDTTLGLDFLEAN